MQRMCNNSQSAEGKACGASSNTPSTFKLPRREQSAREYSQVYYCIACTAYLDACEHMRHETHLWLWREDSKQIWHDQTMHALLQLAPNPLQE